MHVNREIGPLPWGAAERSGDRPRKLLTLLWFACLVAAMLGVAIAAPSALCTILAANALAAAP